MTGVCKTLAGNRGTVIPPGVRLRWIHLRRVLGWLLWPVLATLASGAAKPDYSKALDFGIKLQRDFGRRHSQAVIDRLDEDQLRRKVFSAYTEEVVSSPEVLALWNDGFYPGFLSRLKQLDGLQQMILTRVLSLDGTRLLECELVGKEGYIQLVYWELAENAEGTITIVDQRIRGEELSYSRRLKHLFLLEGFSSGVAVGDDEMDLERESAGCHLRVKEALAALDKNQFDAAFQLWADLPEEVKKTAIWRDVRFTLAARGGKLALESLQADIQAGKPGIDHLLCYNAAIERADYPTAQRELDQVLMDTYDAPVFQAMKCELLSKTHHEKEALQLATGVYQLNPYAFAAYLQAATAAVALADLPAAQTVMQDWAQVYAPSLIDALVKKHPDLEKLLQSPAYQKWLNAAPPVKPT